MGAWKQIFKNALDNIAEILGGGLPEELPFYCPTGADPECCQAKWEEWKPRYASCGNDDKCKAKTIVLYHQDVVNECIA